MRQLQKAAMIAAFLIVTGMLIHNLNALYLEPYTLGFENPAKDYANMAKIENAIWSFSFTSSGTTHIVVGFSMMILGLFMSEFFKRALPIAAKLVFLSAVLSGLGFLLTGISDIPGTVYGGILRELNPDHNTEILLMTTIFRGMVNILAIAGLGWFAGMIAWCAGKTDTFPKGFRIFGWINVLPGIISLASPVFGFVYIQLLPLWMLWFALRIRKLEIND
jgi:succinate dehydrogenase hydrophobic anchor subunit